MDDTDLLHWPPSTITDPEELIQHVQHATTDYGKLAQASGGILKPEKCSVYFMDYKFVQGRAEMKSLQDLPEPTRLIEHKGQLLPSHISIPQPDGTKAYIVTHDVATASKVLGVHFTPEGNSTAHVESCVQKGLNWVDHIHTRPLTRSDTWLSFQLQLFPAMSWGLVTVCMQPMRLDAMIQRVYAKALPHLGVNRNIKKEWRTLPERYLGLALPNFPLIALSAKVSFFARDMGIPRPGAERCVGFSVRQLPRGSWTVRELFSMELWIMDTYQQIQLGLKIYGNSLILLRQNFRFKRLIRSLAYEWETDL